MDSANVSGTDRRTETQRSNKSYVKQQLESIYQQMMKSQYASLVPADRDKSAWCHRRSDTSATDTSQNTRAGTADDLQAPVNDSQQLNRSDNEMTDPMIDDALTDILAQLNSGDSSVNVGDLMDLPSTSDGGSSEDVDLSSLDIQPEYHTGRPTYTCPKCSKQFFYVSQFRQHVRFHLKHRPFRCPVCSKTFVQSSNLTEHFRVHSDERPFTCEFCDRRFRQSSNLNYHVRTAHSQTDDTPVEQQSEMATGDGGQQAIMDKKSSSPAVTKKSESSKSFSCEHCGRKFTHACQLTNHIRAHTNDRPFRCQFCQKTFSYSSNLAEHVRIHTGERPYVCGTCGRCFAQSSQLKVHVKAHHPDSGGSGSPLVVCSVCDLRVSGLRALREHLKLHKPAKSKQSTTAKSLCLKLPSAAKLKASRAKPSFRHLTGSRKSMPQKRGSHVDHSNRCHYVCCYCKVAFTERHALLTHLWLHEEPSFEPSQPQQSTSHHTSVNIKSEARSETKLSTMNVEAEGTWSPLKDHSSTSDHTLSCPHCPKRFAHKRQWRSHLKMHKTQMSHSKGLGRGSNAKKGQQGRDSKSRGQRVEQPEKRKGPMVVKVENENSVDNDPVESSMDTWSDGDDDTQEPDSMPTECQEQRKDADSSDGNLPADDVTTGTRKTRSPRRRSKPVSPGSSRTYPCDQCDRVMASPAAMHYHRRTHSGDKPFACSQCPRSFILRGQLVEHERVHSGEKPFACDQCPKRFAQSSQLRQHASIHSEIATHVCPTCGEAFTRPWRLKSHRRAAHDEDTESQKRYHCEDCGREYSVRQSWIYHRLTHSSDRPFQCDFCSKQFLVAAQLRQHTNHCHNRRVVE